MSGKAPAPKNPALPIQRRIHIATGAKDLEAGLKAYQELKELGSDVRVEVYNALIHLASSLGNMAVCDAILSDMMASPVKPVEATYSTLIRATAEAGDVTGAFRYYEMMKSSGLCTRLRSFSPILAMLARLALSGVSRETHAHKVFVPPGPDAASSGDQLAAIYAELQATSMDLLEGDYLSMLTGYGATGRGQQALDSILPVMMETIYSVSASCTGPLEQFFRSAPSPPGKQWKVATVDIGPEGHCECTGGTLRSLLLSPEELSQLQREVQALATDTPERAKQWTEFTDWMATHGPFDVIVDGANAGFLNQNFAGGGFSHAQVDAVVQQLQDFYSDSVPPKRILIVLHSRWFDVGTDTKPVKRKKGKVVKPSSRAVAAASGAKDSESTSVLPSAAAASAGAGGASPRTGQRKRGRAGDGAVPEPAKNPFCEKWKAAGNVYAVHRGNNDDWYWLYAAVYFGGALRVNVVTNDQMRDHHFNMLGPRFFLKWRERHQVKLDVKPSTRHSSGFAVSFSFPSKYSRRIQPSEDGTAWYFPISDTPSTWFVAWLVPEEAEAVPTVCPSE